MHLPDYTAIVLYPGDHLAAYALLVGAMLLLATTLWLVTDPSRPHLAARTLLEWSVTAVATTAWLADGYTDVAPAAIVLLGSSLTLTIHPLLRRRVHAR